MKRILLAGATLLALTAAQPTLAADAPVYKGPAPVAAALFNWTGFYAGLQGGYGWGGSDIVLSVPFAVAWNHDGWFGGGLVGFNYQMQSVVVGVEADWNFSGIRGAVDIGLPGPSNIFSSKLDSFGSVRGRLGFTGGQWLIFATAGYSWGSATHTQNVPASPPPGSASTTFSGLTAGAGIEYAITLNLLARLEYRHYWWDRQSLVMLPNFLNRTFLMGLDTVSIGLAWKM